jgi:hypothetical protein
MKKLSSTDMHKHVQFLFIELKFKTLEIVK